MGAQDISWLNLISGYALLLIPIFIFSYYKTGLTKDMLWAITRMTIQLFLVGVYLEFIFTLNSWLVNLAWVLIMIAVTAYTVTDRAQLSRKLFILPVFISIFISLALVDLYLLGVVLKLDFIFEARYFIPITGMLIGNTLADMVISLNNFYKGISKQQTTSLCPGKRSNTVGSPFTLYARGNPGHDEPRYSNNSSDGTSLLTRNDDRPDTGR